MSIKAVKSEILSEGYDERFVIIDTDTGEILDDSHGSGYRTPLRALRCYNFKHSIKGQNEMAMDKKERIAKKERRMIKQRAEKAKRKAWVKNMKTCGEESGKE